MTLRNKLTVGIWNIGFIESSISDIMEKKEYKIKWMRHKYRDRFFADPFIFQEDDNFYVILAEEYKFFDHVGRIVKLTVEKKNMKLINKEYIIKEKYHLSYPNITEKSILVEGYNSGSVYSYEMSGNSLIKKKEIDLPLIDPTTLFYGNTNWIFGTMKDIEHSDAQSKLFAYYIKDGQYKPHKLNPIKNDFQNSRPGGKFFYYNKELYRPAQNCTNFYGEDIRIMKINMLNPDCFEEEEYITIKNPDNSKYKGLHTFNIAKNSVIIDGYFERISILKILYVKFKKVYLFFDKDKKDNGYNIKNCNIVGEEECDV